MKTSNENICTCGHEKWWHFEPDNIHYRNCKKYLSGQFRFCPCKKFKPQSREIMVTNYRTPDSSKSDEEILKEAGYSKVLMKQKYSGALNKVRKAIALTRKACEKEQEKLWLDNLEKVNDRVKFEVRAERERILEIIRKLYQPRFALKVMNATQGKQESDDWFRGYNDAIKSEMGIEEELKKEVLK